MVFYKSVLRINRVKFVGLYPLSERVVLVTYIIAGVASQNKKQIRRWVGSILSRMFGFGTQHYKPGGGGAKPYKPSDLSFPSKMKDMRYTNRMPGNKNGKTFSVQANINDFNENNPF